MEDGRTVSMTNPFQRETAMPSFLRLPPSLGVLIAALPMAFAGAGCDIDFDDDRDRHHRHRGDRGDKEGCNKGGFDDYDDDRPVNGDRPTDGDPSTEDPQPVDGEPTITPVDEPDTPNPDPVDNPTDPTDPTDPGDEPTDPTGEPDPTAEPCVIDDHCAVGSFCGDDGFCAELQCADLTNEAACLADQGCKPVYSGVDCVDSSGGECTSSDTDCTCASFAFAVCVDRE